MMNKSSALSCLIDALAACMPGLDTQPLHTSMPNSPEQHSVLSWLYIELGKQHLMEYEEWKEYFGHLPSLKPLEGLTLADDPADHVMRSLMEFHEEQLGIRDSLLWYFIPWIEHINYYLIPYNIKLITITPVDNAYFFCVYNDKKLIENFERSLAPFELGLNYHNALGPVDTITYLYALLRGEIVS